MNAPRVVVTGLGPVTPIGLGARVFHDAQLACETGVRKITLFDASDLPVRIAGEVDIPGSFAWDARDEALTDRCTHLAAVAAQLALEDSGLDLSVEDPSRVGVVVGTGIGGVATWEHAAYTAFERGYHALSARFIPMAMANSAASWITVRYGINGPSLAVNTACASGAHAIAVGHMLIASGQADVVLAGGAEAPLTPIIVSGFAQMRALSRHNDEPDRASRPFHRHRDGFVLAEGAAMLVLESEAHAAARTANIQATLAGTGSSSDAYHMTKPLPDGESARRALAAAMSSAGIAADAVSYLNAHGTGTPYNDASEAKAIHAALGAAAARIPISSTKSLTGHSLGASGAIEAVASVQAITSGMIPPTANLDDPDPALGLEFVAFEPRPARVQTVLSSSFAFGGHNVVLAFTRG
jgi:3-oxoacyl-[acyl-carrier-protein] synthase II